MIKSFVNSKLKKSGITINGHNPWDIKVHKPKFYLHLLRGSLGLGESYVDGIWDCEKLDEFFYRLVRTGVDCKFPRLDKKISDIISKLINLQDRIRSRKVAELHYDLGNDFYQSMLDPYMQYTCGYWAKAKDLNQAQKDKLDLICRKLQLKSGEKVLEMGCGWGGFARFAAEKYKCHVTAVNISKEQVAYAQEHCRKLPVEIIHSDYRDVNGVFDKVVSIGMLEHVGYKNYAALMKHVHNCLKSRSIALVHSIGGNKSTISTDPWLDKYIFPNSKIPSIKQIAEASEPYLVVEDLHNLSVDYDKTLMAWYDNFVSHWSLYEKRYGPKFYRMWSYYLLVCAGLFRARKTQLWQIVFSRDGVEGGYRSIR